VGLPGWVIWKSIGFVWAGIIAGSQLLNAIRPVMPFTKRLKLLQEMHTELVKLSLEVEEQWFGISQGDFTEREIHSKLFTLKGKQEDIANRHLATHVLPKKPKLIARANASLDEYLLKNYVGEEEQQDAQDE